MIRMQIRLSVEQARRLEQLAAVQGTSVAELIRIAVDAMLNEAPVIDRDELRRRALDMSGQFNGPVDLAEEHNRYLAEAYEAWPSPLFEKSAKSA